MKRFMIIGKSGSGKTSLLQRLYGQEMDYRKTQTIEAFQSSIDTPGEYLEQKGLYNALIVTAIDCDVILIVQAADDEDSSFPPGLDACFNRPVIGVITKSDLACDIEGARMAKDSLWEAGASQVFVVSAKTGAGLNALRDVMLCD